MKFHKPNSEMYVPDGMEPIAAFARTDYLAVVAHQDDAEYNSPAGILECFGKQDRWFSAAIVTNGAGSSRTGLYADYTDEDMQKVRRLEQKKAAFIGEYGAVALLDYSSSETKDPSNHAPVEDIAAIIRMSCPKVVCTHNLADKHPTHVAVAVKTIKAIRALPMDLRPEKLHGCEAWRSLDWVNDDEKVILDISSHPNILASLSGVFDSQIEGGKRYDAAIAGRRKLNATMISSHASDKAELVALYIDMTPLIKNDSIDIVEYIRGYIHRFEKSVTDLVGGMI